MTNPNDILDAYDELVRLVTILGADTIRSILDRVCGRCAETAAKTSLNNKVWVDSPKEKSATVTAIVAKALPPAQRASETGGCPWCGLDIGKNTMFRHLNNAHRADLEQLYVEDGTKGLQDTFGVPYGTAWNWARKLDGEAE